MKRNMHIYTVLLILLGISSSQDVFAGYTLFTPQIGLGGDATTYLKDNNLNNIQTWDHSNGPASMPYLIPGDDPGLANTLLIYPYRVDNPTMESGGVGGAAQCLTWEGEIVWEYTYTASSNAVIARAQKYSLDYFDDNDEMQGDINEDGILNILDLVSLVNMVLSDEYLNAGDINEDGILNILDVVMLANIILGGNN